MANRKIRKLLQSVQVPMGEMTVGQPLPSGSVQQIDPFLLLHHLHTQTPPGRKPKETGVGPHPHRGFSPVSYIFEGEMNHQDSHGNNEMVGPGGVQWMHAGRGITHSERFTKKFANEGGLLDMIQLWVNTPAKHKMETPYYLPIKPGDFPEIPTEKAKVDLVAGEFQGKKGPARIFSPQIHLKMEAQKGAKAQWEFPRSHNLLVFVLKGKLLIDKQEITKGKLAWMDESGDELAWECLEDARVLIVSGEPLKEPVATYGPFVMNNQTEIMEALRDAQSGKMGVLIED